MPNNFATQIEKLRETIARYEAEQRELGLDLRAQIAELQQRLGSIQLQAGRDLNVGEFVGGDKANTAQTITNTGLGAVGTSGATVAGQGSAAIVGNVGGSVTINNYNTAPGPEPPPSPKPSGNISTI